jgi:hypothetical protein
MIRVQRPWRETVSRRTAKSSGCEFIEVFSNLTILDDATVRFAAEAGLCFATSVYSDGAAEHNAATQVIHIMSCS